MEENQSNLNKEIPARPRRWHRGAFFALIVVSIVLLGSASWIIAQEVGSLSNLRTDLAIASIHRRNLSDLSLNYGVWPELKDIEFFEKTKEQLIVAKTDFIEADLSTMRIRMFQDGVPTLEVPIKSKGREGSWWETPSGVYKIESKEKSHFSSIGRVTMPFSMRFQGNFYIHGWPYYSNGDPVSSSYSGGCIRLDDADAEALYELATADMPVLVHEKDFAADGFSYQLQVPELSAKSYLVADMGNNFIMLAGAEGAKHKTITAPMIMTALLASEHRNIEHVIDDETSIYNLLWPLVTNSSLEAEEKIASVFGTKEYARLAKKKLSSMGALDTVITGPAYLGAGESTARDMFGLAKYLYNNRPFLLSLGRGTQSRAYGVPDYKQEPSQIRGLDGFVGGLVAKERPEVVASEQSATAILFASSTSELDTSSPGLDAFAVFELSLGRAKRPVAFVVLDSLDPEGDIKLMRSFVLSQYK